MGEFIATAYIIKVSRYQKTGANWTRYDVTAYNPESAELVTGHISGGGFWYKGNSKDNGKTPLKFFVNGGKIIDFETVKEGRKNEKV